MRNLNLGSFGHMRAFITLICLSLLAVGCNDDESASSETAVDSGFALADGLVLPGIVDSAIGGSDADLERLGYLEPCDDNDDCQSGWCVSSAAGDVCSRICFERSDCEENWNCRVVSNTPPDVISICLPPTNRLCGLCSVDRDCPGGHCYELDGESICGLDCEEAADCPENYTCQSVNERQTCVPNTQSCSCSETSSGEIRFCERRNDFGACFGREVCDPSTGWFGCDAQEPIAEICNGADDDCNGFTDDIFGLGEVCTREADVAGERISCAGLIVCGPDSSEPICTATDPMEETCNFIDDDCDGNTDEGFDENGEICVVGQGLCQRIGVYECSEDGERVQCSVEPNSPSAELCDGLDNDCDERVDETFGDLNNICTVGQGACQAAGIWQCSGDFTALECSVTAREATDEFCDSLDNDCDANIDEDFPNLLEPCSVGEGACKRQGFVFCSDDGLGTACTAEAGLPADEICNGLDDDCDGTPDEGFEGVNEPCFAGLGTCRSPGITVCTEDGSGIECNATAGMPSDETCNGLDDNCDGFIDEPYVDLGRPCDSGALGICQSRGVFTCAADGLSTVCDAPTVPPADAELCNGLDDNCDGSVDETFGQLNAICTVGQGACERAGIFICSADGQEEVCNATAGEPSDEICNRLDDNCDGQVDENFPTVGNRCDIGKGLCKRSGILTCNENDPMGAPLCDAEVVSPAEAGLDTCDYQDDDCDGEVDEDYVDGDGQYSGVSNCGACGTDCTPLWDPSPASFGVTPACRRIAGVTQCSFDCLPGFLDADGVASNGCELQPDEGAIYVQTPINGGVDNEACGSVRSPCASIDYALQQALDDDKPRVRVAEGAYRETIEMVEGIALLGGHQRVTWERNPAIYATVIFGDDSDPLHKAVLRATDITQATQVDGFTFNGEPVLYDGNSYGVYLKDCTNALSITNNRIFAANGGIGSDGPSGESGQPGVNGASGRSSFSQNRPNPCNSSILNQGANGGQNQCGGISASGGKGGGARCPNEDQNEQDGQPGKPNNVGGAGGLAATASTIRTPGLCTLGDPRGLDAFPGSAGTAGADGAGGTSAPASLGDTSAHWRGATGNSGGEAGIGGGGGGGGAAAGINVEVDNPRRITVGASGGGGGAGGCAGSAGGGGASGGGSFAIFMVFDTINPASADDFPILENNELWRGIGGRGGSGGKGGGGGEGGLGGLGGTTGEGVDYAFCSLAGAEGGVGGRGGHAGGGSGGQGGNSFDLFIVNSNNIDLNYSESNQFPLSADEPTHGIGGEGGNSSNTANGVGQEGAAGLSGNFAQIP